MSKPRRIGYESGRDLVIEMHHRLRLSRIEAGMEQVEIAKLLEVSSSTVSNWENGRTAPRVSDLSMWAELTGFNMSSLVTPPKLADDTGGAPDQEPE